MSLPKLLVVEDEVLIADDIAELCRLKGYEIVGIALSAGEALNILEEKAPDLVLLDINLMDEITGIDIGEKLEKELKIPFIFITSYTDDHTLGKVASLSPISFIVKPFNKFQLYASLELAWQKYIKRETTELQNKLKDLGVKLTQREFQVLETYLRGKTAQQIGEELFLSRNTIKYHIKNIYDKLDVHSKAEVFIKLN